MQRYPIQNPYDEKVLARMLTQVAMADGILADEEQDFISGFIGQKYTINQLRQLPKLIQSEFDQVSNHNIKKNLFMLAWTMALTDEDFAAEEKELLMQFAGALRLQSSEVKECRNMARAYILTNIIDGLYSTQGFSANSRARIVQLGSQMGISEADSLAIEAEYQRTHS